MPTQLWAVQDTLFTLFTEAVAGEDKVRVFRGPRERSGSAPRGAVLVGADGGDTGTDPPLEDALTAEQNLDSMGPGTWRREQGSILCAVWTWTGSKDVQIARSSSMSLFELCEAALVADPTLGGLLVADGRAEISNFSVREQLTNGGPVVRVAFVVAYSALLTD